MNDVTTKILDAIQKAVTNKNKIPIVTEAIKKNINVSNKVSSEVLSQAILKAIQGGIQPSKLVTPVATVLGTNKGSVIANKVPPEVLSQAILKAVKNGVKPETLQKSFGNKSYPIAGMNGEFLTIPKNQLFKFPNMNNVKKRMENSSEVYIPFGPENTRNLMNGTRAKWTFLKSGPRGTGYHRIFIRNNNSSKTIPGYYYGNHIVTNSTGVLGKQKGYILGKKPLLETVRNGLKTEKAPGFFSSFSGRKPAPAVEAGAKPEKAPGFFSSFFGRKTAPAAAAGAKPVPSFIPVKKNAKGKPLPPPPGYVLKTNNKGTGYYKNNTALESQLLPRPRPESRPYNGYRPYERRGPNAAPSITFAPKINVTGGRTGAVNVHGARTGALNVRGGQGRTGAINVRGVNIAPQTRTVQTTPEQLIKNAGGIGNVEKGVEALRAANGNVNKARELSRVPLNTFTNIYAMGGPVAAKKAVSRIRRRRQTTKKKHVVSKPRRKFIKLTSYQFKRLTEHIKKNNLRKVLIKEIIRKH